jgi:hypothetical protein
METNSLVVRLITALLLPILWSTMLPRHRGLADSSYLIAEFVVVLK